MWLHGSEDSVPIITGQPEPVVNDGNFLSLLQILIKSGDKN